MPRKRRVRTVSCIRGYHTPVGKLYLCERELNNAVGMYCGSKDRQLSDTTVVPTHSLKRVHKHKMSEAIRTFQKVTM